LILHRFFHSSACEKTFAGQESENGVVLSQSEIVSDKSEGEVVWKPVKKTSINLNCRYSGLKRHRAEAVHGNLN
jgi:hypothetical protein